MQRESFEALMARCLAAGARGVHLSPGHPPLLRVEGELRPEDGAAGLEAVQLEALLAALLTPAQRERYACAGSLVGSLDLASGRRVRLSLSRCGGAPALALRPLVERVDSLSALHLPENLAELTRAREGLLLLTGPAGGGKSTTCAALLARIAAGRACHLVSLEDPVELRLPPGKALVHQRELHSDVPDLVAGIAAALREDADVIGVGALPEAATLQAALRAAESGRLVLALIPAADARAALERLAARVDPSERDVLRERLARQLRAVVATRLLPAGTGRRPWVEQLRVSSAAAALIRGGQTRRLEATLESEAGLGSRSFEQALLHGVLDGWLAEAVARRCSRDPESFPDRLRVARRAPAVAPSSGRGRPAWW